MILSKKRAFTLAELLIALAILGVIATFTIPKVIASQQSADFRAKTKEFAATLSQVRQNLALKGQLSANTSTDDFAANMNLIGLGWGYVLDMEVGGPTHDCDLAGGWECWKLHNGGVVFFPNGHTFGGTGSTNAIWFYFDPDGKVSGPGKESVVMFIFYDGKVRTWADIPANTITGNDAFSPHGPDPVSEPAWFKWN